MNTMQKSHLLLMDGAKYFLKSRLLFMDGAKWLISHFNFSRIF